MPRTNRDGKDVKLVVSWLCKRVLTDSELAQALDMPTSNYSRRKDAPDFPTFEELETFAKAFKLNPLALQISFGYLSQEHATLLDDAGIRQYIEVGFGEVPSFYSGATTRRRTAVEAVRRPPATKPRMRRRKDVPAGP